MLRPSLPGLNESSSIPNFLLPFFKHGETRNQLGDLHHRARELAPLSVAFQQLDHSLRPRAERLASAKRHNNRQHPRSLRRHHGPF